MQDATRKVVPIHGAEREGKVYNFELTFNLGNKAQGRIFTDFPQSIGEEELATAIDMLDRQARRQAARYDLDELERELEDRQAQLAQWNMDFAEAERAHQTATAALDEREKRAKAAQADVLQRGKQAHADRGGRGEYKPEGETARTVKRYEGELREIDAERRKLEAERDQANNNLQINIKAVTKTIAKLEEKIARKRALLAAKE